MPVVGAFRPRAEPDKICERLAVGFTPFYSRSYASTKGFPVRWSQTLIPTMKETPEGAEIPSHVLMLRAGLVSQLMAGAYSYLPLGLRALRKAERIVREEMDNAGAVELLMPALTPLNLWEKTGRVEA